MTQKQNFAADDIIRAASPAGDACTERVLIAGSGGQGIVLIGRLLAGMALPHVPHITFFPAYGAEVRGGMSNCQLVFSERTIASPVGDRFDSMILMNDICVQRFLPALRPGGLLIYEADLCASLCSGDPAAAEETDGKRIGIAATRLAASLGQPRSANFIMLGAWMAARDVFPADRLNDEVTGVFAGKPESLISGNIVAFEAGVALVTPPGNRGRRTSNAEVRKR